jgi:hypothetical protein
MWDQALWERCFITLDVVLVVLFFVNVLYKISLKNRKKVKFAKKNEKKKCKKKERKKNTQKKSKKT